MVSRKTPQEIQDYVATLIAQGVREKHAAPQSHRMLWRLGIHVTPPFNQSFLAGCLYSTLWNFLWLASFLNVLMMLIVWVFGLGLQFRPLEMVSAHIYLWVLGYSLVGGLWGAVYRQYRRKTVTIPPW